MPPSKTSRTFAANSSSATGGGAQSSTGSCVRKSFAIRRRSGSIAIERFTGPQIRRFFRADPAAYTRTGHIHLVSSFIASVIAGKSVAIDFGDGAGMNLLNLATLAWDQGLLDATAPGLFAKLPAPAAATHFAARAEEHVAAVADQHDPDVCAKSLRVDEICHCPVTYRLC